MANPYDSGLDKTPANVELPTYTRAEFGKFYKALFENQSKREDYRVVWTEYFWNMAWCDPCAADPTSSKCDRALTCCTSNHSLSAANAFWRSR